MIEVHELESGKKLLLRLRPEGVYEFAYTQGGGIPESLSGIYTSIQDAMRAAEVYLSKNTKWPNQKSKSTPSSKDSSQKAPL